MGIIVDLFSGGGGASQGIFEALGRHPDVAINHSHKAVAIHAANHPHTEHWCNDVWSVDPSWVAGKYNQPVDLLWASPDCTHHSKAKGGPPNRDERQRDLAMVISHKWVPVLMPRLIVLENVEEFLDWGPCDSNGVPIESAKGENFRAFVNALRRRGYKVEWRELSACDYGAPQPANAFFSWQGVTGSPLSGRNQLTARQTARKFFPASCFPGARRLKSLTGLCLARPFSPHLKKFGNSTVCGRFGPWRKTP